MGRKARVPDRRLRIQEGPAAEVVKFNTEAHALIVIKRWAFFCEVNIKPVGGGTPGHIQKGRRK